MFRKNADILQYYRYLCILLSQDRSSDWWARVGSLGWRFQESLSWTQGYTNFCTYKISLHTIWTYLTVLFMILMIKVSTFVLLWLFCIPVFAFTTYERDCASTFKSCRGNTRSSTSLMRLHFTSCPSCFFSFSSAWCRRCRPRRQSGSIEVYLSSPSLQLFFSTTTLLIPLSHPFCQSYSFISQYILFAYTACTSNLPFSSAPLSLSSSTSCSKFASISTQKSIIINKIHHLKSKSLCVF